MSNISVLILTLNEERSLPDCLESVKWSDDVVVFDSFSTDQTVGIATAAGARVIQRPFDNYAAQRNAALGVGFRNPWVLMFDADERVTPALRDEMLAAVQTAAPDTGLFRVRRKDMFLGCWLRRSGGYPTWFPRLMRPEKVRVERAINEETVAEGSVLLLKDHLMHYPFNKGVAFWIERHNRYSSMEAAALLSEVQERLAWRHLVGRDPVARRKALKQLAYRLPGRPLLVFAYLFIARFGFLDGLPGLHYCLLRVMYEYMIDIKVKELRRRVRGQAM